MACYLAATIAWKKGTFFGYYYQEITVLITIFVAFKFACTAGGKSIYFWPRKKIKLEIDAVEFCFSGPCIEHAKP